ncbi:type II toxin-antitoxin system RelE/ParE family toxin [Blastopirellula marina]|uniref:Type II toxin-antitoxin system RelE/ParE family toxin n=1 Tax=Blastopirellula marina TaxID=124 RepID=A0A2S8FWH1_9BACT|nr:type II toxin-antitoxin system RelE/ParE family toxin [Blastopirellula marina]PQO36526.1 type II toxin-antitoxin system RelE/ParE family toxin [Blastopirellula marina]PQO47475.1 type II toxin-antitoxin system RelE/ParE family toxin [Blastopirellula marina]PTL44365.1 type II toxin-antitoxin system RelE/ParE family toxin [Blastopirellula marina]
MAYRLAKAATFDLTEIVGYVGDRTELGVKRLLTRFYERFRLLASQPLMGEHVEGTADWRFSVLGSYVIFYRPAGIGVEILRILHGSRDIAAIIRQP